MEVQFKIDTKVFSNIMKMFILGNNVTLNPLVRFYIETIKNAQQKMDACIKLQYELDRINELYNNSSMYDPLEKLGIKIREDEVKKYIRPIKQKPVRNWKKKRFYE